MKLSGVPKHQEVGICPWDPGLGMKGTVLPLEALLFAGASKNVSRETLVPGDDPQNQSRPCYLLFLPLGEFQGSSVH